MRRRNDSDLPFILAGLWLATQLFGPLLLTALAAGEHSLRYGGWADAFVLAHDHEPAGSPRHGGLERHVVPAATSGPEHGDHLVTLPEAESAKRPDFETCDPSPGLQSACASFLPRPARDPGEIASKTTGLRAPPLRVRMPLLL